MKAHIIPQALIKEILPSDGKALLVIEKGLHYTPRSRTGEYDSEILCVPCDQYLGQFEDIGIKILRSIENFEGITSQKDPNLKAYKLTQFDYIGFKLFILSILWKASISKRFAYAAVKLGPYEDRAKNLLLNKDFGKDTEFSIFITKFKPSKQEQFDLEEASIHKVFIAPLKIKVEDVNYYHFSVLEYDICIKVSNKGIPYKLLPVSLMRDQPFYIYELDFDGSKKFEFILKSILEQEEAKKTYQNKKRTK